MSKREYDASLHLSWKANRGPGNAFYSLIMAAMREADTPNLNVLREHWPDVYTELADRYNAPGGFLPGEACTGALQAGTVVEGLSDVFPSLESP